MKEIHILISCHVNVTLEVRVLNPRPIVWLRGTSRRAMGSTFELPVCVFAVSLHFYKWLKTTILDNLMLSKWKANLSFMLAICEGVYFVVLLNFLYPFLILYFLFVIILSSSAIPLQCVNECCLLWRIFCSYLALNFMHLPNTFTPWADPNTTTFTLALNWVFQFDLTAK